jgi:hypothetical protein
LPRPVGTGRRRRQKNRIAPPEMVRFFCCEIGHGSGDLFLVEFADEGHELVEAVIDAEV